MTGEGAIKPCPVCMAPNPADATECVECGAAFGQASVLIPYQVGGASGPRWQISRVKPGRLSHRQAMARLGMGLVSGIPLFAIGALMACFAATEQQGLLDFATFWAGVAAMLFTVWDIALRFRSLRHALRSNRHR